MELLWLDKTAVDKFNHQVFILGACPFTNTFNRSPQPLRGEEVSAHVFGVSDWGFESIQREPSQSQVIWMSIWRFSSKGLGQLWVQTIWELRCPCWNLFFTMSWMTENLHSQRDDMLPPFFFYPTTDATAVPEPAFTEPLWLNRIQMKVGQNNKAMAVS